MTRSDLVVQLAERFGQLTHRDTEFAVKTILDAMASALARGHRIEIRGFGSFSINRRPPRVGRNPRSGEQVVISEKLVPHFKPGKALREAVDARVGAKRGEPVEAAEPPPHRSPASKATRPPDAMRTLVWLFRAAVFFVLFAFALNNREEASIHWFFGQVWQRADGPHRPRRVRPRLRVRHLRDGAELVAPSPPRPQPHATRHRQAGRRRPDRRRRRRRPSCIRRAMDFELQWLLWALPLAFALGWVASRLDVRQFRRDQKEPKAYHKGLNFLLNEEHDKAIDAFIEAVQQDPDTSDLHFALGNLFRRRGEYERAVRVHQHLLGRADLPKDERVRAQHALAQDYMKAGLFDRAEDAYKALAGSAFDTESRLALLDLHERAREWQCGDRGRPPAREQRHRLVRVAHRALLVRARARGRRRAIRPEPPTPPSPKRARSRRATPGRCSSPASAPRPAATMPRRCACGTR